MSDSLSSTTTEWWIERASWVNLPDPGFWKSIRHQWDDVGLLDGAYFWLNGSAVIHTNGEKYEWPHWSIILCNPGVNKTSLFLSDVFAGRVLAVLDDCGSIGHDITFPEAESEWWIVEKSYLHAWEYLGKNAMNPMSRILIAQGVVSESVYQITRKGIWKMVITG